MIVCWRRAACSARRSCRAILKKCASSGRRSQTFLLRPARDRLRRLYCSTADTSRVIDGQWYDLKLNYTQYEISTIVGGARVTITKLINELCAEGFIRVLNRKTQINIEQYKQEIEKDWA